MRGRGLPADRNPVAVYLGRLISPASRRTMAGALTTAARILTRNPSAMAPALDWSRVEYQHVAYLRAELLRRYQPTTAKKILVAVRCVLAEARALGHLTHEQYGAAIGVPRITLPKKPPAGRDLRETELATLFKLIAAKPSPTRERDACMMALLVGCGLRRAEAVGLDVADYDRGEGKVRVRGKGGGVREVYCRNEVQVALEAWLHARGARGISADGPLLLHVDRHHLIRPGRLSTTAVYKRVAHYVKATPHDLRRTFVGRSLDAGTDLATVQQVVGHASPVTTSKYDRRGGRARERAADLVRLPVVSRH